MKWQTKTREERKKKLESWHKWFAWHPVSIKAKDGITHNHWLTRIYRKGTYSGGYADYGWEWEYCENIFDILSQPEKNEILPLPAIIGDMYVEPSGDLKYYDGTSWKTIGQLTKE